MTNIYLIDADKVQRGKRWSQVMYLYYLIGWKIDACQEMTNQQLLEKDKSFILALDGDVDFVWLSYRHIRHVCTRLYCILSFILS